MGAIYAPIWGCNLGDTLWVTPLERYEPNLVVQMLGHDLRSRMTAPILDGVCKVEFVDKTTETPKAKIQKHVTQQILTAYGHGGKQSIPFVRLTSEELKWAKEFLRSIGVESLERSIAITNHNSGSGDPTNVRAHYVLPPPQAIQQIANYWTSIGFHVIQFGPAKKYHDSDPFKQVDGALTVRGLSVRQLASCYSVIGRFIGGDSGDYHLATACGAEVRCLVPAHNDALGYRHWDLLYGAECWGNETPRVKYALHSDWQYFLNKDLFSL